MALKSNGVTQVPDGLGSANQVLKVNSAGTAGEWGSIATTDNTKLPLAGGTMTGAINMGGAKITMLLILQALKILQQRTTLTPPT